MNAARRPYVVSLFVAAQMAGSKEERAIALTMYASELSAANIANVWPWWAWTAHLAAGITIARIVAARR